MGENKKYYWLKLKEDFFTDIRMRRLRKISGGASYTIIYLKLLLLSLRDEGKLFFEKVDETFIKELALLIDEVEDDIALTLQYLMRVGLLEEVAEDEYFITELPNLIGCETASTKRSRNWRNKQINPKALQCNTDETPMKQKRNTEIEIEKDIDIDNRLIDCETAWAEKKYREQIKTQAKGTLSSPCPQNVLEMSSPCPRDVRQEKEKEKEIDIDKRLISCETASTKRSKNWRNEQINQKALQCNTNATPTQRQYNANATLTQQKRNTEIEIEIEIEIDKRLYKSIVEYLNLKTGKNFKTNNSKTKQLINAREKEGFGLDDFKKVIDNKCAEWLMDVKYNKFLRPETLFGTKFESYLNATPIVNRAVLPDWYATRNIPKPIEEVPDEEMLTKFREKAKKLGI